MAVEQEGESLQPPQLRVCACKHPLAFTALSSANFGTLKPHEIISPGHNKTILASEGFHCCTTSILFTSKMLVTGNPKVTNPSGGDEGCYSLFHSPAGNR